MNERIRELMEQAGLYDFVIESMGINEEMEKFAELIVEECRTVINDVYHKTPLELCGPLLTVDGEIMNHFYGVEE
jgi:hypothetical protein